MKRSFLLPLALGLLVPPTFAADDVLNFSLLDYRGKHHELRRTDARVVVLFWTGNGCPVARQSVSKLRALRSKFGSEGVAFAMVNSNPADTREAIAAEAEEFRVGSIPVLKDDLQTVANAYKVRRTGEAIAVDTKKMKVIYRGAIDDQLTAGAKKPQPTEKYLETALKQFVAGEPVTRAEAPVHGCLIAFEDAPKTEVSYVKEIAPILKNKCVSCHSPGNIGPWAMSNHKKVKSMSAMIAETILAKQMPPWHADGAPGIFHNDRSLTADETKLLLRWIEQGCPPGPGEDPLPGSAPAPVEWALGTPDIVIPLPGTEQIPATGVVPYRYVDADVEMPRDSWIRAGVVRPDNKRVVHHVIVRVKYPPGAKHRPEEEVFFTSWAPGNTSLEFPGGTGKFLPKGARFNFELHYNTTGKAETDRSELGLYFMSATPKMVLETRTAESRDLNIPPGEPDARSFCMYHFKRDTLIFDLIPHMHLRGSWFKYEALYPDGKRETLLSVPRYDFNWQTEYRFAEPKRVPAGTWMLCTGAHDNSTMNPANPDPKRRVKWGLQSHEEMFMGFMNVSEIPQVATAE